MATAEDLSRTLESGHQPFYVFPCSLCEDEGKHVEAMKYCEECFVYMCNNCLTTIHNRIPLNTSHNLLGQGQFTAVSQTVLKSFPTKHCFKHSGERLNIFCGNHDVLCCSVCKALEHSTCNKTQHLPDAAKGIKTSTEFQYIRKETKNFLSDLNKLLNDRKANRYRIDKEKQQVKRTIADFRQKANKYLDDLEQKSLNELNFKEKLIISGLEKDRQFLNNTKKEAEDILQRLDSFSGDNECELFFQVKTCKCFIEESTERVEDISSTSPKSVVFNINDRIERYLNSLPTFGMFDEKHSPTVQSSSSASETITSSGQLPDSKDMIHLAFTPPTNVPSVAAPRRKDQTTKPPTDNKCRTSEDNSMWNDRPTNIDTVQLLCECSRNAAQNFEGEFSRRIKDKFDDRSINILTVETDTIDACKKLIVLCFNTSRSSSDAKNAIKHIKNPANTVLVLIQNKGVHALEYKSSAIRNDKKFKALAGIFDLGFLKETGIHKCDMNSNTMTEICGFIKNIQ